MISMRYVKFDKSDESPPVDVDLIDNVGRSEVKHSSLAAATGSRTQGLDLKCSSGASAGQ